MHGAQVRVGMIVAGANVVYPVGARTATQMTDPAMVAEDPLTLRVPFLRETDSAIGVRPSTGSHQITSQTPEEQSSGVRPRPRRNTMPNDQYADVRCEVCKKHFGDGLAAYRAAVKHVEQAHGKIEPARKR